MKLFEDCFNIKFVTWHNGMKKREKERALRNKVLFQE